MEKDIVLMIFFRYVYLIIFRNIEYLCLRCFGEIFFGKLFVVFDKGGF